MRAPRLHSEPARHSALEDAQGLALGVVLCGSGLHILTHLGLVTGQTAGIAAILSYLTGWTFGAVFFVINLPFYWLAWTRLGAEFTLKSLLSVTALSLLTTWLPSVWEIGRLATGYGALLFGCMVGLGLLAMFRHNGSLGGVGVLALVVQERTGMRAGYVQLAVDAVIFAVAAFLFPLPVVAWSLLGAAVMNLIIAVNHRRDRYIAT